MAGHRIEYVGFKVSGSMRDYTLLVSQPGGEPHSFTLAIPNEAFLDRRVRYQDAPDICFLKLQHELIEHGETLPALYLEVTNAELEEYRVAHTPKPNKNRPKVPF
jgi:hypothetical protein